MKPFPRALRRRVVNALAQGQTRKQVAQRFDVSLSSVTRWAKQFREITHKDVKPVLGRPKAINQAQKQIIQELVTTQKNYTLATLCQALQQQGQNVSKSVLHRELIQLGFRVRKSKTATGRDREKRNAYPE